MAVHVGCKMLIRPDFIWATVTGNIKLICCCIDAELNAQTKTQSVRPPLSFHAAAVS